MWPFKKNDEKTAKCNHESVTSDCNLVQKLKELQAQKKEIEKQIEDYDSHNRIVVDNFIKLLIKFEQVGGFLYCNHSILLDDDKCGISKHFEYFGTSKLEYALGSFSDHEVQKICNELKGLSDKVNIIAEKREIANKLAAEIKDIKDILGIE